MILVYHTADQKIVLEVMDRMLIMDRDEAEQLFVDLGHTLQDQDVEYWQDKTGDGTEQPEGIE